MNHEKSIFLANMLREVGVSPEAAVEIYNMILVNKGDIKLPNQCPFCGNNKTYPCCVKEDTIYTVCCECGANAPTKLWPTN